MRRDDSIELPLHVMGFAAGCVAGALALLAGIAATLLWGGELWP